MTAYAVDPVAPVTEAGTVPVLSAAEAVAIAGELSAFLAVTVPAAYGGADLGAATLAEVFRLLAAGDPSVAQIPHSHFVYVNALRQQGTPEQQRFFFAEVLHAALDATIARAALTEAAAFVTTQSRPYTGGERRPDRRLRGRRQPGRGSSTCRHLRDSGRRFQQTVRGLRYQVDAEQPQPRPALAQRSHPHAPRPGRLEGPAPRAAHARRHLPAQPRTALRRHDD
ncbi:MAG: monooxygenase [Marmoricola sp.]|nr:monooxygenase [Marmoricola sp.]